MNEIISMSIKDIVPYINNPRNNDSAVDAVANSIKEFGFKVPIVIDKDNVIVCGHTRYRAAKKLKLKKVPCILADDLTDEQIKAFRLVDNKTSELSEWDDGLLDLEIDNIQSIDLTNFGFEIDLDFDDPKERVEDKKEDLRSSLQHNVFENQEVMQFPTTGKYGMPEIRATLTQGKKMCRFCDYKDIENPEEYIAHFYYDDYKFIQAWRDPNKYLDKLKMFKAVVSPDFSLYTDFPIALQILSCYRRQWCGAYWQYHGIDVIPDVVWGDKESYDFCFEGIPKNSVVAVSTVGVKNDTDWNGADGDVFKAGYDEMLNRLEPKAVLFYGSMIKGLQGNIIRIPSFYEERRKMLNERSKDNW